MSIHQATRAKLLIFYVSVIAGQFWFKGKGLLIENQMLNANVVRINR